MESLRKIYYILSPSLRLAARKAFYFPIDQWETLTGKRHKYQPPRGDIYTGSGDFIEQGNLQHSHLINHSHIQPDHRVLDIGSGIGRTAVSLTSFLNSDGSYEGFDVVEKGEILNFHIQIKSSTLHFYFPYLHIWRLSKSHITLPKFIGYSSQVGNAYSLALYMTKSLKLKLVNENSSIFHLKVTVLDLWIKKLPLLILL